MRLRFESLGLSSVLLVVLAVTSHSQQPSPAAAAPAPSTLPIPAVGDLAPDFAIRGITRYGVIRDPMRLSDFRGETVVLWFFIKARTRG